MQQILSEETYALMARCLKGEGSVEDERALAEMLLLKEDLEKEYEIFHVLFRPWHEPDLEPDTEHDFRKRFEKITERLRGENLL